MGTDDRSFIADPASGLFSEAFLRAILPTRVATARRSLKQLGLVLVHIGPVDGDRPAELDLAAIGTLVHHTLRDSDIAARLDDGRVAMLLEFTPVEGCSVVANRFAERLADEQAGLGAWAGLACYPAHAIDDDELLTASTRALADARARDPGSVVVAPVAD